MSSQKFEKGSYCAGGKHRSATENIFGEITINKKTGRQIKILVGQCSICNRKKSMIVNDNAIKIWQKNVLNNPAKALDITANIATAAVSRNPKNVMKSLHELITFYNTDKGLYLGKFV